MHSPLPAPEPRIWPSVLLAAVTVAVTMFLLLPFVAG